MPERIRHDGSIETALDEQAVREAARALRAADVKAVAVCFLYAFLAPEHEARARRILEEELPGAFLTASHEVAPEFREYERLSTAVVNSYLGPVMQGYIRRLGVRLAELVGWYFIVGGLGLALENRVGQIAPQRWEFYAITGCLFLVAAYPGFVYRYLRKRHA